MVIHKWSGQFDVRNAWALAQLADAAYGDPDAFRARFGSGVPPAPELIVGSICGTQCYVGSTSGAVIVAFRGTYGELKDLVTNALLVQCAGYGGRVHTGFHLALTEVWDRVRMSVDARLDSGRELCLTGHSLGGGLATLAAARFHESGHGPLHVYTFGAPRVGDRAFVRHCPTPVFRLVNRRDIVSHLPIERTGLARQLHMTWTRLLGLGAIDYAHSGTLEFIDARGRLVHDIGDLQIVIDGLVDGVTKRSTDRIDSVADHQMGGYIASLEKLAREP